MAVKLGAVSSFVVDGQEVTLTRVAIRRHTWGFEKDSDGRTIGHPQERSLYEIRVDGTHVGFAPRPHGFGKAGFQIERLGTGYIGGLGDAVVHGGRRKGHRHHADELLDLESVARKAAELRRTQRYPGLSYLPTTTEIDAYVKRQAKETAERELAAKERADQAAAERLERERQAEQARREILDGLKSINQRLGSTLTNFEANALRIAIQQYTRPGDEDRENEHTCAGESIK